jgi:hypothetical protein
MQQRPTGVTILAVLAAIGGVFSIFGGLSLVALGGAIGAATSSTDLGILGIGFGAYMFVIGALYLLMSFGFWTAKPWGWILGIAIAIVSMAGTIAQLVLGYTGIFSAVISVIVPAIILYYLNQPAVKRYFGR